MQFKKISMLLGIYLLLALVRGSFHISGEKPEFAFNDLCTHFQESLSKQSTYIYRLLWKIWVFSKSMFQGMYV